MILDLAKRATRHTTIVSGLQSKSLNPSATMSTFWGCSSDGELQFCYRIVSRHNPFPRSESNSNPKSNGHSITNLYVNHLVCHNTKLSASR